MRADSTDLRERVLRDSDAGMRADAVAGPSFLAYVEQILTLWLLLGECLQRFSPEECRSYFRHAGYSGARRS